jgi:transcriptional regulator with XRE-family HTH domain
MTIEPIYQPFIVGYKRLESVGYTIFKARLELNLTLGETADKTGINNLRLSAIENDQIEPTDEELKTLCKHLNINQS